MDQRMHGSEPSGAARGHSTRMRVERTDPDLAPSAGGQSP